MKAATRSEAEGDAPKERKPRAGEILTHFEDADGCRVEARVWYFDDEWVDVWGRWTSLGYTECPVCCEANGEVVCTPDEIAFEVPGP